MKQKPQLSDEEIQRHMNFEKLLEMNKRATQVNRLRQWSSISMYSVTALVVISAIIYFLIPGNDNTTKDNQPTGNLFSQNDSIAGAPMQTIDSVKEVEMNTTPATVKQSEAKAEIKTKPETDDDVTSEQESQSKHTVKKSISTFTEAEPVDGYPKLYEYFNNELQYPKAMAKDSIQGTVTVSFAIDESGKPGEIKIVNSLGEAFDKESIRIIENMPAWKPATVDGTPTKVRLSIPLTFRIEQFNTIRK